MMLSRRPETSATSDTEEDLFAGMSFPDAPTGAIVLTPSESRIDEHSLLTLDTKGITALSAAADESIISQISDREIIVSESIDSSSNINTNIPSSALLGFNEFVRPEQQQPQPQQPQPQQEVEQLVGVETGECVRPNWSSLYATEGARTAPGRPGYSYPVLPKEVPRFVAIAASTAAAVDFDVHSQGQSLDHTATAYSSSSSSDCEHMSLLHETPSAPPDPYPEMERMQHRERLVSTAAAGTAKVPTQSAHDMVSGTVYNPTASASGTQTSTVTSALEGAATDKYVCCGQCRQWLQVPREAQMVHCPQCNVINNCGLMPHSTSSHRSVIAQRDPNTSGGGIGAWLSFCFDNIVTDFNDLSSSFLNTQRDQNNNNRGGSGNNRSYYRYEPRPPPFPSHRHAQQHGYSAYPTEHRPGPGGPGGRQDNGRP